MKKVTIHHYHPETGEYIGTEEQKRAKGLGLPAHSTDVKPPVPDDGCAVCFISGKWVSVVDCRDEEYYDGDGNKVVVTKLGKIPEDYTVEPPPPTMDDIKAKRNSLLTQSDWTQLHDSPLKENEEWATYRQALRDIPQDFGNPKDVVFPSKPV